MTSAPTMQADPDALGIVAPEGLPSIRLRDLVPLSKIGEHLPPLPDGRTVSLSCVYRQVKKKRIPAVQVLGKMYTHPAWVLAVMEGPEEDGSIHGHGNRKTRRAQRLAAEKQADDEGL